MTSLKRPHSMIRIHTTKFYLPFKVIVLWVALSFGFEASAQSWPSGVHDPSSIIKDGDTYWVFSTGDGIYCKYSTDMVTWSDGALPFVDGEFPEWILNYCKTSTDQFSGYFWAPDIIYMNNKYYLYYSCSLWGTMSSCIGCVVNKTLDPSSNDYEWIDQGDLGLYSSGGDVNAIDPAMMRGPNDKIWMVYGSFNRGGIMITEVDSISGKPIGAKTSIANSWTGGNTYGEGEGGAMFYRNGYYYLVYNKGGCCSGIASTYYMVIGRSKSPTGPFLDKTNRRLKVDGSKSGGTVFFKHDDDKGLEDRYYGPGHFGLFQENGSDYISFHYYAPNGYYPNEAANNMGGPTLGLALLKWSEDGWPILSFDFLDDGVYSITNSNSNRAMDVRNHTTSNNAYLWQYAANPSLNSQKWVFKSLGTGEYTIQNYANPKMYLEATGNDNNETLRITSAYTEQINQKFRVVKGVDNKLLIYPSTKDNIFEIPYAYTNDYQIKLWSNTNHACQRWTAQQHDISFDVYGSNMDLGYSDTTFSNIMIAGNALWSITFDDDSWLQATPNTGEGETILSIHADVNPTDVMRTNKIHINSHTGEKGSILISQAANPKPNAINDELVTSIKVYPNPSEGNVYIDGIVSRSRINVYSSVGVKVLTTEVNRSHSVIDISPFKAGLYLFEISNQNIKTQRMLIKK
jgi:arabinan endo-1,5-alpha-L-arabinosidase